MHNHPMRSLALLIVAALHPVQAFCSSSFVGIRSFAARPPTAAAAFSHGDGNALAVATSIRGGAVDNAEFAGVAYDWAVNLGAPAALVAGAVVATLYENVRGGALEVTADDSKYARFAKQLTTLLLTTSFALQIVSIFVTTVTGTMLLSRDANVVAKASSAVSTTALGYLRANFEFEYLTSRLSFLQGLLNWIAAVAVEHTIPRSDEGPFTRKVNLFIASSLASLMLLIISFYNSHMTFYENYFQMITRWSLVTFKRFFLKWPPRPMAFLYVPSLVTTIWLGFRAFTGAPSPAKDDGDIVAQ